jgi:hypothetical protein
MAEEFNFSLDEGVDTAVHIVYKPDDVLFDLTGYTAKAQLRKHSFAALALELTSSTGGISVSIPDAVLTLNFTAANTLGLFGNYNYDITINNGVSSRRVAEGLITISPAITK